MSDDDRSQIDRRDDMDRRRLHDLDYFEAQGAEERRCFQEQRRNRERRSGWVRIGRWVSMLAEALGFRKPGKFTK